MSITQLDLISCSNNGYIWGHGSEFLVEFFPGEFTKVRLVESGYLSRDDLVWIDDLSEKLALDTEWEPFIHNAPISVIQIGSTKGALLIHIINNIDPSFIDIMRDFISKHKFISKGCSQDISKLKNMFGLAINYDIEDIETTRLRPHLFSPNFQSMVEEFARKPSIPFKDKRITLSEWSKHLSQAQCTYAAFDVVALVKCFPNFPESYNESANRKIIFRLLGDYSIIEQILNTLEPDTVKKVYRSKLDSSFIIITFNNEESKYYFSDKVHSNPEYNNVIYYANQ